VTGITELRQQRLQYNRLLVYSPCDVGSKKLKWSLQMNRISFPLFTAATALAVVLALPLSAHAQGASEALYKSKCAMCHGPDGKKAAGHDLQSADVQNRSDADLVAVITNGKAPKMPKYGDKLKPEEIKGLVAYIRTLK
jgi:mono/diheme cytochrome c family protein